MKRKKTTPRKSADNAKRMERRHHALQLRKVGATYREIAQTMRENGAAPKNYSPSTAYEDVTYELKRLDEHNQEEAAIVKRLELERLDRMLSALDDQIEAGDTKAINAALRISERRSAILGLDAPSKLETTGKDGAPLASAPIVVNLIREAPKEAVD